MPASLKAAGGNRPPFFEASVTGADACNQAGDKMHEVTKEQFRELFFKYYGEDNEYYKSSWDELYGKPSMKYMVKMPESPDHDRLMIVTDFEAREYRMFFMTEEAEESLFDW